MDSQNLNKVTSQKGESGNNNLGGSNNGYIGYESYRGKCGKKKFDKSNIQC